jgi:hypothetical protein
MYKVNTNAGETKIDKLPENALSVTVAFPHNLLMEIVEMVEWKYLCVVPKALVRIHSLDIIYTKIMYGIIITKQQLEI